MHTTPKGKTPTHLADSDLNVEMQLFDDSGGLIFAASNESVGGDDGGQSHGSGSKDSEDGGETHYEWEIESEGGWKVVS